jgi:SOS-response transcriptional repressor LexA
MTYDEMVELIRSEAKAQKRTQADLARVAGMPSQSAISNVFKGKRRLTIQESNLLQDFLGIAHEPQVQWVPVIGLASAGAWQEAVLTPVRHFPVPRGVAGNRSFGVEIKGDSMNLLLPEGGWAVVDPDQRSLFAGRVYLIQNGDHEATVKRYCGDPARFEPVSNNPLHEAFTLEDTPYQVVGRIVSYGNTAGL